MRDLVNSFFELESTVELRALEFVSLFCAQAGFFVSSRSRYLVARLLFASGSPFLPSFIYFCANLLHYLSRCTVSCVS